MSPASSPSDSSSRSESEDAHRTDGPTSPTDPESVEAELKDGANYGDLHTSNQSL